MNRKQKIVAGVACFGVAAVLIDRLFIGSPAEAVAETARTSPKAAGAAAVAKVVATDLADPSLDRLERMRTYPTGRDVFQTTPRMLQHYENLEQLVGTEEGESGPKPGSPEAFVAENRLQGTFAAGASILAIVNGRVLRVGDEIEGFRLERVLRTAAEFRRGTDRVTLSLPSPLEAP